MSEQTLAVKYRPKTFDDMVEQESTKVILQQQLQNGSIKNAYLFCGPAGDGKTTTARIFANEINKGQGNPIEMDAASHNGVDDVRSIIQQAKTKSIDSEYKCFIIDECHSISNTGWQAFLKIIEEPPAKSIFLFCTTDPERIPKTILSRVQRFDFHKISQKGIMQRLTHILHKEDIPEVEGGLEAVEYIAKLSYGGMRDAISLMEKCLAYSEELTISNVVKALGTVDYEDMINLTEEIITGHTKEVIGIIEAIHDAGKDLKQFIKSYIQFLIDVQKYAIGCDWKYITIPQTNTVLEWLEHRDNYDVCFDLLDKIMKLNADIKYSSSAKYDLEGCILSFMMGGAV